MWWSGYGLGGAGMGWQLWLVSAVVVLGIWGGVVAVVMVMFRASGRDRGLRDAAAEPDSGARLRRAGDADDGRGVMGHGGSQ